MKESSERFKKAFPNMHIAATLRERGQQIALFNAGNEWALCAIYELRRFLRHQQAQLAANTFTFDQFRSWNERHGELYEPRSQNAWGVLPKLALREGLIRQTDRTVQASRAKSHGRLVRVWEIA